MKIVLLPRCSHISWVWLELVRLDVRPSRFVIHQECSVSSFIYYSELSHYGEYLRLAQLEVFGCRIPS